jgi:serine/threonine protein phosphatase PrpC
MIVAAKRLERGTGGDDRVAVETFGDVTVIVVADGAGGTGTGGSTAEAICGRIIAAAAAGMRGAASWADLLAETDREIADLGSGGESTTVVVELGATSVCGASVGDSEAWLVDAPIAIYLTEAQNRKPLVGSGRAVPVAFGPSAFTGRLLVATDGLFSYCSPPDTRRLAASGTVEDAASALVAAVRLRSGALPDDLALVLAEFAG